APEGGAGGPSRSGPEVPQPEAPAKRERRRAGLGPFLLASVLLHAALMHLLPDAPLQAQSPPPETLTEVTLLPQPEEERETLTVAEAPGGRGATAPGRTAASGPPAYVPADLGAIQGRAQAISRDSSSGNPERDVELPAASSV